LSRDEEPEKKKKDETKDGRNENGGINNEGT
jgi:hypothetical protein